ncbi:54S ribosomal protein L7, mitochondrial [Malassezia cuniculi]|uniref:54S ribosomal protein L7, mitochondrial n=1 Tax=Malassezia cuniculi TaxID=948313 RepID=A0AAF0J5P3_9BASI|nr:54S ribosomal protein L7, mitochondrial [Malassezia cuniculi]
MLLLRAPLRSLWPRRGVHTSAVSALDYVPSRTQLPSIPVEVGAVQMNRLDEHYRRSLATDMLYMMYEPDSESTSAKDARAGNAPADGAGANAVHDENRVRRWATGSPYESGRIPRPQRGNRSLIPLHKPLSISKHIMHELPRIERVVITTFCRDAIANKQALLPSIAQLRAITGLPVVGSQGDPRVTEPDLRQNPNGFVQVLRAKKGVASFKLRQGMPIGAQAVMTGDAAYDFIESLTTFVLPRLRGFAGVPLPPASQPALSPAAVSGVVSFGLGPEALSLFPQVEVNLDQYPGRRNGFQIDFVTNQRGRRATERARTLLSGLGVPFTAFGAASTAKAPGVEPEIQLTADGIGSDIGPHGRPLWKLTSYGPARGDPNLIAGLDYSQDEARVAAYQARAMGQGAAYQQQEQQRVSQADAAYQQAKGNTKAALQQALNNRAQQKGAAPMPGAFGAAQPSAFGGAAQPSAFGTTQPTQPSAFGNTAQPSAFGSTAQPSTLGTAKPSAFGSTAQPTAFGSAAQPSAFGGTAKPT